MTDATGGTILLLSDVHSHYRVIEEQIGHARDTLGRSPDRVLVLGDFGLFGPNLHDFFRRDGRRFSAPVDFIEGNHEDFRSFDVLVDEYSDVVTHLPRNSRQVFASRNWLCIGGARYMDSWSTPSGCEISDGDIKQCLEYAPGSVDIVISHDSPTGIGVTSEPELGHLGKPGVEGLSKVASHFKPGLWVFGHHHRWHDLERDGTRYIGLPQSWNGYILLDDNGMVEMVDHEVELPRRPGWWRWIGLR